MSGERDWVRTLEPQIQLVLDHCSHGEWNPRVQSGGKLAYAHEILQYSKDDEPAAHPPRKYETDLLIYDEKDDHDWIPRVVLECKLGGVSTHDALTYSTKAATHKHVHPYLRYGILIGGLGTALPGRLIRHGAFFDFMMVLEGEVPTPEEHLLIAKLIKDEVTASRDLQGFLVRTKGQKKYRLLHRRLDLSESDLQSADTEND